MDEQNVVVGPKKKKEKNYYRSSFVCFLIYVISVCGAFMLAGDYIPAFMVLALHIPLLVVMFMKKRGEPLAITVMVSAGAYVYLVIRMFLVGYMEGSPLLTRIGGIILLVLVEFLMYLMLALFALAGVDGKYKAIGSKKGLIHGLFVFLMIFEFMGHYPIVATPVSRLNTPSPASSVKDIIVYLIASICLLVASVFRFISLTQLRRWACPYKKEKKNRVQTEAKVIEENEKTKKERKKYYVSLFSHVVRLIFTFGIWNLIWIHRSTAFTNLAQKEDKRSPVGQMFLCLLVPFYYIYWTYKTAKRIDRIAKERGVVSDIGTICLVLSIFISFIPPILMQAKINQILTEGKQPDESEVPTEQNEADKQERTVMSDADELRKYKQLLDEGVITQADYDAKKKQIMGI